MLGVGAQKSVLSAVMTRGEASPSRVWASFDIFARLFGRFIPALTLMLAFVTASIACTEDDGLVEPPGSDAQNSSVDTGPTVEVGVPQTDPDGSVGPLDAGAVDAFNGGVGDVGENGFPCCVNNIITVCVCQEGVSCNSEPFDDCGNGTCGTSTSPCPN